MEIAKKTLQMVREHLPPSGTKIGEYVFLVLMIYGLEQ